MATGHSLINRILFATDFSVCAHYAEAYAAVLSKAYGASVKVVHVLELYPGMYAAVEDHGETDARLDDAVRRLQQPTIPVTGLQMMGIPSMQICTAAMDYQADVIVMGTHGRTGLEHIFLGSTAERVLTMAPCPVLTAREPNRSEGHTRVPIKFEHVTVPIDFSDCSVDALEYGVQITKEFGADLTLLHVLEPVFYGDDFTLRHRVEDGRPDERIGAQLRAFVSAIQSAGVSVREVIRGGVPADSILEFVHASATDLLVMGTHGRRGISRMLKGSVAEAVLCQAPCPVIAVKSFTSTSGRQPVVARQTESVTDVPAWFTSGAHLVKESGTPIDALCMIDSFSRETCNWAGNHVATHERNVLGCAVRCRGTQR